MKQKFLFVLFAISLVFSCKEDDEIVPPPTISGLEKTYTIEVGENLKLIPEVSGGENIVYSWTLDSKEVTTTKDYVFKASKEGDYKLVLKATNKGGTAQKNVSVKVIKKEVLPTISGLEKEYNLKYETKLELTPSVFSSSQATYSWLLDNKEIANTKDYTFHATKPGKHLLTFQATNTKGTATFEISILVEEQNIEVSTTTYTILSLETPEYFKNSANIQWKVLNAPSKLHRLSFAENTPLFAAAEAGEYQLEVTDGEIKATLKVMVTARDKKPSAFISKVFDYLPAPGQFVNKLPPYAKGDTREDMTRKVEELISGEDTYMVTLGGWGGYVTVGFDHTIVNVKGRCDFRINGNAFGAAANSRPNAPFGGSCEPGIIMVAYDKNKNGKPDDDEWYELAGSSNFSAEKEYFYEIGKQTNTDMRVMRNYEMTYYRPKSETPDKVKPDKKSFYVLIKNYIHWADNKGQEGYKVKNIYHSQTYYPEWIQEDQLTFKGVRLPQNGINEYQFNPDINEVGMYFVLYGFRYGYVDNHPNKDKKSAIDIDWAVDKEGNSIALPGIDFVKIYSGVNQENGWLGECSTEVDRGEDLHLLGQNIETFK